MTYSYINTVESLSYLRIPNVETPPWKFSPLVVQGSNHTSAMDRIDLQTAESEPLARRALSASAIYVREHGEGWLYDPSVLVDTWIYLGGNDDPWKRPTCPSRAKKAVFDLWEDTSEVDDDDDHSAVWSGRPHSSEWLDFHLYMGSTHQMTYFLEQITVSIPGCGIFYLLRSDLWFSGTFLTRWIRAE